MTSNNEQRRRTNETSECLRVRSERTLYVHCTISHSQQCLFTLNISVRWHYEQCTDINADGVHGVTAAVASVMVLLVVVFSRRCALRRHFDFLSRSHA